MNRVLVLLAFLSLGLCASAAPSGTSEIENLLTYIRELDGAVFLRNGGEHSAVQAESHLRLKWEKQAKRINAAEDFIALCASKSSTSGERYRIRLRDGTERFCDELLTEQLQRLRKKPGGAHPASP